MAGRHKEDLSRVICGPGSGHEAEQSLSDEPGRTTRSHPAFTMTATKRYMISVALIVALGGFVWGFDATVISGAVPFLRKYFQ